MRNAIILAASFATCTICAAQQAGVEKLLTQADPAIQSQIKATVIAFGSARQAGVKTNWKGYRELAALKELANDEQLVKQLAIYAVAEQRPEETQVLEALLVIRFLDPKPRIPIRVLAPYLGSDNDQLRDFASDWFDWQFSACPAEGSRNDQEYANYVGGKMMRKEEIPSGFVEYLFEQSPERALLIFSRAYGQRDVVAKLQHEREKMEAARQGRPIPQQSAEQQRQQEQDREQRRELVLAELIVGNAIRLKGYDEQFQKALPEAKEQLAKLSKRNEWWARLYVTKIMRQHRELQIAEVLDDLSDDENELVSKQAQGLRGSRP
jgi:hypothetical protein